MNKDLSNIDIALFALYRLGGVSGKVHTERIAWEAFQLSKEKFSWRLPEFRDKGFPDKTTVRHALEQAKKAAKGALISGRGGGDASGELEGWQFTPAGIEWIKGNETRITEGLKQKGPNAPKRDAERFIRKLKSDTFFKYFQEKGTLIDTPQYMFTDMLVCAPDASKDIVRQKFEQLVKSAELVNDKEIIQFLSACKEKYKHILD